MRKPQTSEQVQVNFRMPADLKARIEAAAVLNGRSTTAEIVSTLEEKYPAPVQRGLVEIRAAADKAHHPSGITIFYETAPNSAEGFVRQLRDLGYSASIVTIDGKRYIETL